MKLVLLAAVGEDGAIGIAGQLPWRLGTDLRRFRARTMDRPVLMGRRTYQSIGRPLDGRTSIVVSRGGGLDGPDLLFVHSILEGLGRGVVDAEDRGVGEVIVAGGGEIFAATIGVADVLEITHVRASPGGDAHFPPINSRVWREVSRTEHEAGPADDFAFSCATYVRR